LDLCSWRSSAYWGSHPFRSPVLLEAVAIAPTVTSHMRRLHEARGELLQALARRNKYQTH
jgi:hypothetical protein